MAPGGLSIMERNTVIAFVHLFGKGPSVRESPVGENVTRTRVSKFFRLLSMRRFDVADLLGYDVHGDRKGERTIHGYCAGAEWPAPRVSLPLVAIERGIREALVDKSTVVVGKLSILRTGSHTYTSSSDLSVAYSVECSGYK